MRAKWVWGAIGLGICLAGAETLAQEVGIDDGKARCHPWLQYLREHPTELVKFTGKDEFGQKIKLLADKRGGYWRLALMAGAEDSMFGCFILEGTSWIGPDD